MVTVIAQIEMGSTIVAVTILLLIGAIMIAAIFRFKTMDEILKLWAGLGTLVGLVVGTMGAYFFTKDAADRTVAKAETEKTLLVSENKAALKAQEVLIAKHDAERKAFAAEKEALVAKLAAADQRYEIAASRIPWVPTVAPAASPAKEPEPPVASPK